VKQDPDSAWIIKYCHATGWLSADEEREGWGILHRTAEETLQILINVVILFTVLTAAYVAISYFEFKEYTVSDCVDYAKGLCSLIEDELNAEHIDDYIEKGFDYPGYTDIRSRLGKLRDAYPDIVYLYVYHVHSE